MKRSGFNVLTKAARFTKEVVPLAKKAGTGPLVAAYDQANMARLTG